MARQQDLPEVGARKIPDLHAAAEAYADIRDQRQALTPKEVAAKAELLRLMHKHKKDVYEFDGVRIERILEEETVKVKILKPKEDEVD